MPKSFVSVHKLTDTWCRLCNKCSCHSAIFPWNVLAGLVLVYNDKPSSSLLFHPAYKQEGWESISWSTPHTLGPSWKLCRWLVHLGYWEEVNLERGEGALWLLNNAHEGKRVLVHWHIIERWGFQSLSKQRHPFSLLLVCTTGSVTGTTRTSLQVHFHGAVRGQLMVENWMIWTTAEKLALFIRSPQRHLVWLGLTAKKKRPFSKILLSVWHLSLVLKGGDSTPLYGEL